jgi:bifunctional DNase/RNase
MPGMVEVVIDSLRVSLTNQQRIVVLREIGVERYLPIWIGPYEAEAITIALQEIEIARPQTHDLIKNILNMLNARLLRVEVSSLKDDVFFGNLVVEVNGEIIKIDSRPSDALAVAVRTNAPIMVDREVIEKAGVVPEKDLSNEKSDMNLPGTTAEPQSEEGEDRLSIFEDYLEKLDIDDLDNPSDDDEEPEGPSPEI